MFLCLRFLCRFHSHFCHSDEREITLEIRQRLAILHAEFRCDFSSVEMTKRWQIFNFFFTTKPKRVIKQVD